MNRTTIDYGIDLGTTNSAIALLAGTGTEIIKNNLNNDITPSAIYINRGGNLWVGQAARSKIVDERAEEDVALDFKRRIGTGYEYEFRASGRRMLPEALSAEVLKSLRGDVAQRKGEDISAAVITVPAAFELHQCEATQRAARLAGFTVAPLLQEPVAAALAYGFRKLDAKAYWLVFDFGGGTFDAALIRSNEGSMTVVNHAGDNFLGGIDLDWAIVHEVLAPRVAKEFAVAEFVRGSEKYKYDLLRLKAAAETAKIELSTKEVTFLETTLRSVGAQTVTFETEITRAEISRAVEPIIVKAVAIAKRVLAAKGVAPSAVEKVVFVGGPTLAPYFRDIVAAQLGIPFDSTVDPLTIVARGAAIFAGGQRLAPVPRSSAPISQFSLDLIYKPIGADPEPLIGGRVTASSGASLQGYTIELSNQQSKWRGGRVPLNEKGAFQLTARADQEVKNTFVLELRDSTGAPCPVIPSQFDYTVGVGVEEQPIINNLGVAMADNRVTVHFTKGQGLPAKCTKTYRTSTAVQSGASGSVVKIPIVEGNHELADRNVLIGSLDIASDKVTRDLPGGSEIEVTLHMDASRILTVVAYVPLLDAEFPAKIALGGKLRQPDVAVLSHEFQREMNRLLALPAGLDETRDAPILQRLRALAASPAVATLGQDLARPGVGFDTLLQNERALIEFKLQIDALAPLATWPLLVQSAHGWLADLSALVRPHGTAEEKSRAQILREHVEAAIAEKKSDRLKKKIDEVSDLHSSILYRQPSFWSSHFAALVESRAQMSQPDQAAELIERGRACVEPAQIEELKNVIYLLQDLLPPQVVERARRGYDSSLLV